MEFGRSSSPSSFIKMLSSTFLLLLLFTTFPSSIEAAKCNQNGVCFAASEYNVNTFYTKMDLYKKQIRNCHDGCAIFSCVVDKKKVMFGSGCYSDYEKVCKDAPAEAKIDVKELTVLPTFLTAPNHFLLTCAFENCALSYFASEMGKNIGFLTYEFLNGADQNFTDTCEYPAPPGPTPPKTPVEPPKDETEVPQQETKSTQNSENVPSAQTSKDSSTSTQKPSDDENLDTSCFPGAPMPWCNSSGRLMYTYSTFAASILVILFARFMDIEF